MIAQLQSKIYNNKSQLIKENINLNSVFKLVSEDPKQVEVKSFLQSNLYQNNIEEFSKMKDVIEKELKSAISDLDQKDLASAYSKLIGIRSRMYSSLK